MEEKIMVKSKVYPFPKLYGMKTYGKCGGKAPYIIDLNTGWR
jgi:hypothetical protein